jgi:hypothetical protein
MQPKTVQLIGAALILVGLLFALNIVSFATLVVDTTPPEIANTYPANGSVYTSILAIDCYFRDLESGIQSATFQIGSTVYTLTYAGAAPSSFPNCEWWTYGPMSLNTPGTYSYTVKVTNKAGLQAQQSGSFIIYTQLQGNWYINDQQITSSSQTVYSTSATVSFKFQKTAGLDDAKITCWVEEGGTKLLTLTLTDSTNHIWTGSYTFSLGTHNLVLTAYDGSKKVTMSIVSLQFGQEPSPPPSLSNSQLLGVGLLVVGCVLVWKGKRKSTTHS